MKNVFDLFSAMCDSLFVMNNILPLLTDTQPQASRFHFNPNTGNGVTASGLPFHLVFSAKVVSDNPRRDFERNVQLGETVFEKPCTIYLNFRQESSGEWKAGSEQTRPDFERTIALAFAS